jgi:hypothetical protein
MPLPGRSSSGHNLGGDAGMDSSAPYEAHIVKADGTEVDVQVNSD